jgi:uncharacterized membrane protein YqhA
MLRRMLASSRYVVLIAIVSIFAASLALLAYEAVVIAATLAEAITHGKSSAKASKALAAGLIEAIDVFLIAIVGYITSIGLYSLFVDETLPMPKWLTIHDLDDLKEQLISVVVVVLAVLFLQEIVEHAGELDPLRLATAIAIIIAVLSFFLGLRGKKSSG